MTKITIKRASGNIEEKDISEKFPFMNDKLFSMIKNANAANGDEVIKIEVVEIKSNGQDIIRDYNNLNNEGGEGYIPEDSWIKSQPEYTKWEEVKTWS